DARPAPLENVGNSTHEIANTANGIDVVEERIFDSEMIDEHVNAGEEGLMMLAAVARVDAHVITPPQTIHGEQQEVTGLLWKESPKPKNLQQLSDETMTHASKISSKFSSGFKLSQIYGNGKSRAASGAGAEKLLVLPPTTVPDSSALPKAAVGSATTPCSATGEYSTAAISVIAGYTGRSPLDNISSVISLFPRTPAMCSNAVAGASGASHDAASPVDEAVTELLAIDPHGSAEADDGAQEALASSVPAFASASSIKRSRTVFSKSRRKRRKRVGEVLESGEGFGEDPSKLYCYCQQKYDDGLFYIQESQLDSIILFFCIPCETTTGKKTFRRRLCAAYEYTQKLEIELIMEGEQEQQKSLSKGTLTRIKSEHSTAEASRCSSPAPKPLAYSHPATCKTYVPHESDRKSTPPPISDGPAPAELASRVLDTQPAFYCSEECGMSLARYRLLSAIAGATGRDGAILQSKRACARARKQSLAQMCAKIAGNIPTPDRNRWLARCGTVAQGSLGGNGTCAGIQTVPASPTQLNGPSDIEQLKSLAEYGEFLKSYVRALEQWLKRIDDAVETAEYEWNVESTGEGPLCGFDERIIDDWAVPCLGDWMKLTDTERMAYLSESTLDAGANPSGVSSKACMTRGKCTRHIGWKILHIAQTETEINLTMQELENNNQEIQRIIDCIRAKRSAASSF
ncbi:hypothetical protein HDU82_001378, partial [Entophlyctis luteolus]